VRPLAGRWSVTQSSSSSFELWMQRDVAVVVQLADGDTPPERRADGHHRVDGQDEQFAFADPGAGEQLDDQPVWRVGVRAGGAAQLGRSGVVNEPGQWLVCDR
jgi:hypothetical protein